MEYRKTIQEKQKREFPNTVLGLDVINPINWESKNSYWLLRANNSLPTKVKEKILSTNSLLSHIFIASSGTLSRGEIKIIALSKKALLLSATEVNKHLQITKKDRLLSGLPFYHVADLAVKARAYASGASIITENHLKKWSPIDFLALLKKQNISVTSLVPAQVFDLVTNNLASPKNLRLVLVGGSALSSELCHKALRLGWPIIPTYGMTELCSQVATASLEDLAKLQELFFTQEIKAKDIKKEIKNYVTSWKLLPHIKAKVEKEALYLQSKSLLSAEFILKKESVVSKKFYKKEKWFLTGDNVLLKKRTISFKSKSSEKLKIKSKLVLLKELSALLEGLNLSNNLNLTNIHLFLEMHIRDGFRLVLISDVVNISLHKVSSLVRLFNNKVQTHEEIDLIYYFSDIPKTALGKLRVECVKKLLKLNKK